MVNFHIVSALGQNCCKRPKSVILGNLSKNGSVCVTQLPTSIELKIKFDPSLDRSFCEFLLPPPVDIFSKKPLSVLSIYIVVLALILTNKVQRLVVFISIQEQFEEVFVF